MQTRLLVVEKLIADVATKSDLRGEVEALRSEIEKSNEALRREIDLLGRRIDDLQRVTLSSLVAILLTLATVVITRVLWSPSVAQPNHGL